MNIYEKILLTPSFFLELWNEDCRLAEQVRLAGCLVCGGPLHQAHYLRKPRGLPLPSILAEYMCLRLSFCCGRKGCRKRTTPPSLRFLGPKWYVSIAIIFLSSMQQGLEQQARKSLQSMTGASTSTLKRWKRWWCHDFARSRTFIQLRGLFTEKIDANLLPLDTRQALQ